MMTSKVVVDDRGRSKGCGFVVYFDKEAADEAVKQNDGTKWWGKKIVVQHFNLGHRKVGSIFIDNNVKSVLIAVRQSVPQIECSEPERRLRDQRHVERTVHTLRVCYRRTTSEG